MIISLVVNSSKKEAAATASQVTRLLEKRGAKVQEFDGTSPVDFYCTIGGDGTILRLLHEASDLTAPIIGINLGGLGFLAEINASSLEASFDALFKKTYAVKRRIMIQGKTKEGNFIAANDVVIHRGRNRSLIDLSVNVGGRYINTFAADGLILATPTGSTAYSLASGGPILSPELNAFVLTPIAAHTISNRPIVMATDEEITIEYLSPHEPIEVTFDGIESLSLAPHEKLTLSLSPKTFCLAELAGSDFFSTLRGKLGWKGRFRLNEEN